MTRRLLAAPRSQEVLLPSSLAGWRGGARATTLASMVVRLAAMLAVLTAIPAVARGGGA